MSYPGGKNGAGVYQKLINLMPPHLTYVEPFLGSGAIMRIKRAAPGGSVGIDVVESLVAPAPFAIDGDVQFLHADGIGWLERTVLQPSTLVYCDPPYLLHTRGGRRQYENELSEPEHRRLLRVIRKLNCMVMISGYFSSLYATDLGGWNEFRYQAMTRGGTLADEIVWYNFPPAVELHDYSFLGDGFRERERIKRKTVRWTKRLAAMPRLERQALLAAIAATAMPGDGIQ